MFSSFLCGTCQAKGENIEFVQSSPREDVVVIDALIPPLPESLEKVGFPHDDTLSEQSTTGGKSPIESSSSDGAIECSSTLADANDVLNAGTPSSSLCPEPPGTDASLCLPNASTTDKPKVFHKASTGLLRECEELPLPAMPVGLKPLVSQKLPGLNIRSIRESLEADEGPVQRFMQEVLGCSEFSTSPWAASRDVADSQCANKASPDASIFFRRSKYRALLPSDIPNSVARLIGIPDSVDARSLFALGCRDDQLILVQQSMVQGIMFSDRFRLQNTFSFVQEADGVLLSQWAKVIWDKPLPWTHTPVKIFVEKKAKAEAKSTFRDFARIIQDDAC